MNKITVNLIFSCGNEVIDVDAKLNTETGVIQVPDGFVNAIEGEVTITSKQSHYEAFSYEENGVIGIGSYEATKLQGIEPI